MYNIEQINMDPIMLSKTDKEIIVFKPSLHKIRVAPPIHVYEGGAAMYNNSYDPIPVYDRPDHTKINSVFNQKLFKRTTLPEELQRHEGVLSKMFPSWKRTTPFFDIVDKLNALNLQLPASYFLKDRNNDFDTALSATGLSKLMEQYASSTKIAGHTYDNSADFIANIPLILKQAKEKPVACLLNLDPSKRHVTGVYFSSKNDKVTAHFFDTTGLTLPAYPCGMRGYRGSEISNLPDIFGALKENDIQIGIMPINTILSLQNDKFSCLAATIMFFEGMLRNAFQYLDSPGITETYGHSAFYRTTEGQYSMYGFPVTLYTSTYLPLLVGIQNTVAFIFGVDSIPDIDKLFPETIKLMTDWHKQQTTEAPNYNVFWQAAYVELLKWFNSCSLKDECVFPDFSCLMRSSEARSDQSEFEKKINEINEILVRAPKLSATPESNSYTNTLSSPAFFRGTSIQETLDKKLKTSESSSFSSADIIEIRKQIDALYSEIKSSWPYPNKDRKAKKAEGLEALLIKATTMDASAAVIEVEHEFPLIRKGTLSTRTADLLDKLRNNNNAPNPK